MICSICLVEKDEKAFYYRKDQKGRRSNCIACCSISAQKYYLTHKKQSNLASKKYSLEINYKLSLDAHTALGESQNWLCPLCNTRKAEVVDHDHNCCSGKRSCGKCIRALLCKQCNVGMGLLKDDPEILRRAANYVEEFRRTHAV